MSNEMFTQLPTTGAAQLTDIICAVQGFTSPSNLGLSVQETLGQILSLFQSNTILTNAGNPNGNVAGTLYLLCWDSTDKLLYVCTQAGSAVTAVWTPCVGPLGNNQVLLGNSISSLAPTPVTITAGSNMTITQSAGALIFSSTSGFAFPTVTVSGTTQQMTNNTAYVVTNGSLTTLTLPTIAAVGTLIYIVGFGSGGWTIAQNANQNIQIGSVSSTSGIGGSVSSSQRFDTLVLFCVQANDTWITMGAPQSAGLTIV